MLHHRSAAPVIAGVAAVTTVLALVAASSAGAAVFTVTTTDDTRDGTCDAHCSLREAIVTANGTPGPDEVRLGPGIYRLTRSGDGEDAAATGDLDVTDDLVLTGAGAASTIIDGGGLDRILHVVFAESPFDADLEIADLTLRNGHAKRRPIPGPFPFDEANGGAIWADGDLTLTRCHVTANVADQSGGGIYSIGLVEVRDSTISGNTAVTGGGIATDLGFIDLVNVTVSGNRALEGGGGIYGAASSVGVGTIVSSTITANTAPFSAGIAAEPIAVESGNVDPDLRHTIVAGNISSQNPECSLTTDADHNLVAVLGSNGSCPSTTASDLRLAPLGFNGGPTPTHALLPGSPAIDAGAPAPAAGACAATDQRGRLRPADGDGDGTLRCDVGAFERDTACATAGPTLCLGGRFRATASFRTPQGTTGEGQAVALTADTGYFWFFDPANVEVVVKALDACVPFDRHWIFLAGLTNVEVEVTVEDTTTGQRNTYTNPQGRPFQPVLDTDAFATCP